MANTVPIPDRGGWLSGSMSGEPDPRPEFNLPFLLTEVIALLREHGVDIDPAPNQLHVSAIAMADVLRGLGVKPVNAPERRS